MSKSMALSVIARTWDHPTVCLFCEGNLVDPGAGFIAHPEGTPVCAEGFRQWREAVAGDMGGEWSG